MTKKASTSEIVTQLASAAMSAGSTAFPTTNYHVVKIGRRWYVKVGGEIIDSYRTQRDVLRWLRVHCNVMWKQMGVPSETWVHGMDGQVRLKDSSGRDPRETKG